MDSTKVLAESIKNSPGVTVTYITPGIGCAIAGTIVQAIVLGLSFMGAKAAEPKLASREAPSAV